MVVLRDWNDAFEYARRILGYDEERASKYADRCFPEEDHPH